MRLPLALLAAATTAGAQQSAGAAPVKICFDLPGDSPVRVTVAAVDADEPSWIVSHIAFGTVFSNGETAGCVHWNGLDENGWPVPPGSYGLKGILTRATNWTGDGKFHSVAAKFEGAITPFNVSLTAPASAQKFFVDGDPVGASFSTVATSANFPGRTHYANFYHSYLENSFNNYQLDLLKPHGYPQAVNRWHSAGVGGGSATATDGRSIWSYASSFSKYMYRGEPGSENLAVWGACNFSQFYVFPGIVCVAPGNEVLKMEATPGAKPDSAIVYALISGNESELVAMDGYDAAATVLYRRKLQAATANVSTTSFAIRNSVLYVLTSDGIVTREKLTAGLPTDTDMVGDTTSSFNLTALVYSASCQSCGNKTTVKNMGEMSMVTVDSQGTAYVFSGSAGVSRSGGYGGRNSGGKNVLFAVNSSNILVGDMRSSGSDPNGPISQKGFYGLRSMATWVDESTNEESLIILESGGPGRYLQYGLGLSNDTKRCFNCAKVSEIWNNIESGSNSGWVYDPKSANYGWVVKYRHWPRCGVNAKSGNTGECDGSGVAKYPAAQGDLIKFRMNGTDGDFVMEESYAGLCTIFLLGNWCPEGECNTCGRPIIKDVGENRYLAFQDRNKAVFRWNATQKTFVPSAGILVSFVNASGCRSPICYTKIYYTWHDANNDGSWMKCSSNGGASPCVVDFTEVVPVQNQDGFKYNYFVDLMQDDFSFTGVGEYGYWHWAVTGLDAHGNPIYDAQGPQTLLNDSIVEARGTFNASAGDKSTCDVCMGLPPTRGGNEVTGKLAGSRTSSRFVDASHDQLVACMGATGSQFLKNGCFSADACPQYKLAMYNKSSDGKWTNTWRVGTVSLGGVTGSNQFANGKPVNKEGAGIEPMTVHPVIGNTVSVTDQMRAGLFIFTTDGLYIDTLGTAPGGAPGYRKDFDFGSKNVYAWPGEYFGGGQVYVDPTTGQVHLAWGKTTVQAYSVPGWTKDGIAVTPLNFSTPTVTLKADNIATPAGISSQIRGFPPAYANLTIKKVGGTPPALDGSLAGWDNAIKADFQVDGLNVDGPAMIEMRILHSDQDDALFVHIHVNQSLTGWPIVPQKLLPANRMFVHSRPATTCSLYIQGNLSAVRPHTDIKIRAPWEKIEKPDASLNPRKYDVDVEEGVLPVLNNPSRGRPGDARIVFGVFNDSATNGHELALLGIYPFWDSKNGPARPATYAAGTGTMLFENVQLLASVKKKGFVLSKDGSQLSMAAQIPRSAIPDLPAFTADFMTGGDFSCNINGFEKNWWVNADLEASQITWDEPSEASLYPASWGNFSFEGTSEGTSHKSDDDVVPTVRAWRAARFDVKTKFNVTYAQGMNCNGVGYGSAHCRPMDLQLDVSTPAVNQSTGATPDKLKPAVVLFHGGGWSGGDRSGAGGQIYMQANVYRWASRGFVVFNADYRLGADPTKPCPGRDDNTTMGYSVCGNFPSCCTGPSRNPWPSGACQQPSVKPTLYGNESLCPPLVTAYPASRDAKAVVRFVRANADVFAVSSEHIIAVGCSAGGWTATTLAIASEADFKDELTVDDDPTLASTNLHVSSKVAASVVMSGGPQAFDNMAQAVGADFSSPYGKTNAPMVVLHGDEDPAVNVSNAYRNWRAYNRTGVLFEAHIFPETKHCEKGVESEDSMQRLSLPFVARATGISLQEDY